MIFSDSLDESIMYFNYWINEILNNESNSFIFFIEKTEFLNDLKNKNENKLILTNMCNDFEKEINKAISKVKIIDLNISNLFIEYNIFNDISIFLNTIKYKCPYSLKDERSDNYFNKKLDINHFEKLLDIEKFKNYDNYFCKFSNNSIKSNNNIDYYNKNGDEISKCEKSEKSEIAEIQELPELKLYL